MENTNEQTVLPTDKTTAVESAVRRENKPKFKHLVRLWCHAFRTAKGIGILYLGLMVFLAILRPISTFLWGEYIDLATTHLPGGPILPMILLVSVYYLIDILAVAIWRHTEGWASIERLDFVQTNRFQERLNTRVYKKLSHADPEYWEVPKINDTADRTFRFLSDNNEGISRTLMLQGYLVISKIISVLSIAASLYIFDPRLCFIVLLAPLPSLYTLRFSEKLRFKFAKKNSHLLRRANYYQDVLLRHGAKEVKTLGLFDFFYSRWKTQMDEYTIKERRLYRNRSLIDLSNILVTNSVNIGANVLAIALMAAGSISLGALGACMTLIQSLLSHTRQLMQGAAAFLGKKNEAALFYDLTELEDRPGTAECETLSEIAAKDLKYRYPLTDHYVLDNVNLTIRKGEKIAFVGENGAGKTSFVKILAGIMSPSDGELLINNAPVETLATESRFGQTGTVSQNPPRYLTLTVADNVYLGDSLHDRNDERIREALAFSGLLDTEPDTLLGKEIGGTELSGGQWQKLAIARAAYRNKDFIILDEPTSNLDPLAETEVFRKYMELSREKTVIFVTHRISVAALAERIIVFDQGRIVEEGKHDDLLAQDGRYAKLYLEQAKWYDR